MPRATAIVLCCGWLALFAGAARSDSLAVPPEAWRDKVEAVPEVYVARDDAATHEVLVGTRRELVEMLEAAPPVQAVRLGDGYGRLATLYHVHAVAGAAELCYRNAVALSPDNFRWRYYAGELMRERGRYREALDHFSAAGALDAGYRPLRLRMAQAQYEQGDLEQARLNLETVRTTPGLEAAANYQLGRITLLRKQYAQAAKYFLRTLELDPAADQVHYPLAQALRALGENDAAKSHLARHGQTPPRVEDPAADELQALRSGPRARFVRALQAVKDGDYVTAVKDFQQGLAGDPDNARARISYARALYLDGDAEASRRELERALDLQADNDLANFLLGLLADEAGDPATAERYYRRALALAPLHSGARLCLAGLLYRDGRYDESAKYYEDSDPDIPFAPLMRILARGRAGMPWAGSVAALEDLISARPGDPVPLYALIRLLALGADGETRNPERALELTRELLARHPAPPFQALLALVLAANGDVESADLQLEQLEFMPPWISGVDIAALKNEVAALKQGRTLDRVWPEGDPLLRPPPAHAAGPMREYPTELPY